MKNKLAELKKLLVAGSPGDWSFVEGIADCATEVEWSAGEIQSYDGWNIAKVELSGRFPKEDAKLIVTLRNLAAPLITAVEEARKMVDNCYRCGGTGFESVLTYCPDCKATRDALGYLEGRE